MSMTLSVCVNKFLVGKKQKRTVPLLSQWISQVETVKPTFVKSNAQQNEPVYTHMESAFSVETAEHP